MQVVILYFSGTGNTAFVVKALLKSLRMKGVEASSLPLESFISNNSCVSELSADLIGIAFPVHAFNPPPLVEKVLRRMPDINGKEYFVLKTPGSPFLNGGTTTRLQSILTRKGWKLNYEAVVPMPSNFVVRYSDSFIKLTAQLALRQADLIAEAILTGKRSHIHSNPLWKAICVLMRVERLGAVIYGHYYKVDKTCTKCGLCAAQCPTGNITMDKGILRFGWKCTLCMRCSFNCPVQAFTHKHFGRFANVKPPYKLDKIILDASIIPSDLKDDSIPEMKEFRRFWLRNCIIN